MVSNLKQVKPQRQRRRSTMDSKKSFYYPWFYTRHYREHFNVRKTTRKLRVNMSNPVG